VDSDTFARLSHRVATASSRRAALGLLAGTAIAAAIGRDPLSAQAQSAPITHCRPNNMQCQSDKACCSSRCRSGTCRCLNKGKRCWVPLEGSLCCSGSCSHGRCD